MNNPSTPLSVPATGELSPPPSQGAPVPTTTSSLTTPSANMNGKRPLENNSQEDILAPRSNVGSTLSTTNDTDSSGERKVKTQQTSGGYTYSWTKNEDEPGYAWRSKRAMEETERIWGSVIHRERRVGNRYGDPYEMANAEAAVLASQRGS